MDYYSPDDLNRVESNTEELHDLLAAAGYAATLGQIIKTRNMAGYEFAASLSRVEQNIHALAVIFTQPPGYEQPKAWQPGMRHSHVDANRIERNLRLLHEWFVRLEASFRRCGAFYCGDSGDIY